MGRTLFIPTSFKIAVAAAAASFLVWGLVLAYGSSPAHAVATTYTVDRSDDPDLSTTPTAGNCTAAANDCSLRGAITAANANVGEDTINFDLVSPATITLVGSQLPAITDSAGLIIDGGSAKITLSGNNAVRVFQVESGAKLTLNNLTVANGNVGAAAVGGGIYNSGTLTVRNSTISGNSAGNAGGIQNNPSGTLTVSNSTVSGNIANFVGGIYNQGTLTVSNSTISDNTGFIQDGGIYGSPNTTTTLKNTIVANNNSPSGEDCAGTITDGGYNLDSGTSCGFTTENNSLSSKDPMLGPLADNGGPTKTHALLECSPAIDKGNSFGATTDQRGVARPQGAAPDIGAFELEDAIKPKVCTATPTGTGIRRGTNVAATFSEAMKKRTINSSTFTLKQKGSTTDVAATVIYSASTKTATLKPDAKLAAGGTYVATVSTQAKDEAGNRLDQDPATAGNQKASWRFTTGP